MMKFRSVLCRWERRELSQLEAAELLGHLLANTRQAIERWLHGAQARLRRLPVPSGGDKPAVPASRDRAFPRSAPEQAAVAEGRVWWQARHAEVRSRHLPGKRCRAERAAGGHGGPRGGSRWHRPPSLVGEVFTFIMPRVSNPGVLRLERRHLLLDRLEARASA